MNENNISLYDLIEKTNDIARLSDSGILVDQYLELLISVCGGKGCGVFFHKVGGSNDGQLKYQTNSQTKNISRDLKTILQKVTSLTISRQEIVHIQCKEDFEKFGIAIDFNHNGNSINNLLSIPLSMEDGDVNAVLLIVDGLSFDYRLYQWIGNRFINDFINLNAIHAEKIRNEQLECLVDIFGRISSTLDRDQILNLIIEYSYKILCAEAGSLFFLDEKTGESIMYISTNLSELRESEVRVPSGRGIIGTVINTGKTIIVNDVAQDDRHYDKVDKRSGQPTKSILAVPLIARTVVLGGKRGETEQKIIGGLEAINKINGEFNDEDAELLRTLANQAATVLEIAQLYMDANDLFLSSIKALTAAIDAKDSYTEGHSQRVSEISVEIARELNLSDKEIYQVQIGSLLHDIGKIGISDSVLKKPGKLTPEEYAEMKKHPVIGEKIMSQLHLLSSEKLAVAEHHERPDGSGYPKGLKNGEISLFGRIVAVADVFDAMTSDRPYRKSLSVDEVFEHLWQGIDRQFDGQCVEALYRVYLRGGLPMQKEDYQVHDELFKITLDTSI